MYNQRTGVLPVGWTWSNIENAVGRGKWQALNVFAMAAAKITGVE
jgi:hypothetical protein